MRNTQKKNKKANQTERISLRLICIGAAVLSTIIAVALAIYFQLPQRTVIAFEDLTGHMGFRVQDVVVVGRVQVERNELASALNIRAGDPMLRIDLDDTAAK